jgi:hypothetical protein
MDELPNTYQEAIRKMYRTGAPSLIDRDAPERVIEIANKAPEAFVRKYAVGEYGFLERRVEGSEKGLFVDRFDKKDLKNGILTPEMIIPKETGNALEKETRGAQQEEMPIYVPTQRLLLRAMACPHPHDPPICRVVFR